MITSHLLKEYQLPLDLYPLKLSPVYKERIWGGRNLSRLLQKDLPPSGLIGESWDVYDDCIIADGPLAGWRLIEILSTYGEALVGTRAAGNHGKFPLLVKLIDAQDRLSVQVHPDDSYARGKEHVPFGKTEMWYIIAAEGDAEVIHGIAEPGLTSDAIARLARDGRIVDVLQRVAVSAGDAILIPAGTVHAMGGGLMIYEVQQNCDLTYRLYDWDRRGQDGRPRELHVETAARVSRVGPRQHALPKVELHEPYGRRRVLAACRYFASELLELHGTVKGLSRRGTFVAVSVIEGSGEVVWPGGKVTARCGESLVLPAAVSECELRAEAEMRLLRSWVPDLATDIVAPLLAAGVPPDVILRLGGDPETSDLAGLM